MVDVSVNGQNYLGAFEFKFVGDLNIYRLSPMAGPIGGLTKVKLYGNGFVSSDPKEADVYVKFGTISSDRIDKANVTDYTWSDSEYHLDFNTPNTLLVDAEKNDFKLEDGVTVKKYMYASTPDISRTYTYDMPDTTGVGGPVYVQIGEMVSIA
jgi:hypothetical protein